MYEPNGASVGEVLRSVCARRAPALFVEAHATRHQEASDFAAICYPLLRFFCMCGSLRAADSFALHAHLLAGFEAALGERACVGGGAGGGGGADKSTDTHARLAAELLLRDERSRWTGAAGSDVRAARYVVHGSYVPGDSRWAVACKRAAAT